MESGGHDRGEILGSVKRLSCGDLLSCSLYRSTMTSALHMLCGVTQYCAVTNTDRDAGQCESTPLACVSEALGSILCIIETKEINDV